MNANVISISQMCKKNLLVKFNKNKCSVMNITNNCVMEGDRFPNNCYLLTHSTKCYNNRLSTSNIWNRRLRHKSYISLDETIVAYVVRELPKLTNTNRKVMVTVR